MARDRRGVKSIFDEAAEITSPEGRAAYLEHACGGDADLRKMVDALLLALDEAGSFLEATPPSTRRISPLNPWNASRLTAIPCGVPRRRKPPR